MATPVSQAIKKYHSEGDEEGDEEDRNTPEASECVTINE